ncbi:hypothetical protein SteCoe_21566 [Stentor coeruleus]|uniref:Uncharacterized protein n=1 Tax=Stentor coeruleus TaxID=5963 RepID=A0A1R2BPD9_9CILI|nr:hypothetical protein SteCoe_21566 [Stentor coeruleus]
MATRTLVCVLLIGMNLAAQTNIQSILSLSMKNNINFMQITDNKVIDNANIQIDCEDDASTLTENSDDTNVIVVVDATPIIISDNKEVEAEAIIDLEKETIVWDLSFVYM